MTGVHCQASSFHYHCIVHSIYRYFYFFGLFDVGISDGVSPTISTDVVFTLPLKGCIDEVCPVALRLQVNNFI